MKYSQPFGKNVRKPQGGFCGTHAIDSVDGTVDI